MTKSYQESLDYLFSLQFFGIKLGLDNIRSLLDRVGNPQQQLRIIHVAGTNGKGSTSAGITSILHAAGYKTGLYTSPHLHNFTERIRVNTRQISEAEVVSLVDEIRPHAQQLKATFFEVTTAMALLCFARHRVDWVVLETGMGGRLDATNVVVPDLSVITPIALDHGSFLGHTLAAIAAEKAGIIKPGVTVVCAAQEPAAAEVIQQTSAELGCSLLQGDIDFKVVVNSDAGQFSVMRGDAGAGPFTTRLPGRHQWHNLALAVAAVSELQRTGLVVPSAAMATGLTQVRWPGRLEWLGERILIDGAHNDAGIEALTAYLTHLKLTDIHLIFGCKEDKQAAAMLAKLLPFVARVYITTPPAVAAVDPEVLVATARCHGVAAECYASPRAALTSAKLLCKQEETIVAAGSLFLIADLRAALVDNPDVLDIIG